MTSNIFNRFTNYFTSFSFEYFFFFDDYFNTGSINIRLIIITVYSTLTKPISKFILFDRDTQLGRN